MAREPPASFTVTGFSSPASQDTTDCLVPPKRSMIVDSAAVGTKRDRETTGGHRFSMSKNGLAVPQVAREASRLTKEPPNPRLALLLEMIIIYSSCPKSSRYQSVSENDKLLAPTCICYNGPGVSAEKKLNLKFHPPPPMDSQVFATLINH